MKAHDESFSLVQRQLLKDVIKKGSSKNFYIFVGKQVDREVQFQLSQRPACRGDGRTRGYNKTKTEDKMTG